MSEHRFLPPGGRETLRDWFAEGVAAEHRVMFLSIDTFNAFTGDCPLFPEYFDELEKARAAAGNLGPGSIIRLLDVFDLEADFDAQFDEGGKTALARSWGVT